MYGPPSASLLFIRVHDWQSDAFFCPARLHLDDFVFPPGLYMADMGVIERQNMKVCLSTPLFACCPSVGTAQS